MGSSLFVAEFKPKTDKYLVIVMSLFLLWQSIQRFILEKTNHFNRQMF